jgi:hypothetical protein
VVRSGLSIGKTARDVSRETSLAVFCSIWRTI